MGKQSVRIGPDMPDLPTVNARDERPVASAQPSEGVIPSERQVGKLTVRTNNSVEQARNETASQRESRVKSTREVKGLTVKTF